MSKGFCNKHYQQLWRLGRILPEEMPIKDLLGELWADIEEAEGYQVSNMGRVKSLVGRGQLITPQKEHRKHMQNPYYRVYLDRRATRGWVKFLYVHIEVAKAFLPNPHNDKRIVFKDGNSLNCKADNLAWFWEEPPVYREKLAQFRASVTSDLGRKVLAFIDGNDQALNPFIMQHTPRLKRKLRYRFGSVCGTMLEEAVHLAFSKGLRDIKRGLLVADDNIPGWFNTIAKNTLIMELRKDRNLLSEWGYADGEEYSRFDSIAAAN